MTAEQALERAAKALAKPGDWEARFGASRRAIDRKLLAELEKQIALEERIAEREIPTKVGPVDRAAIARAFGRPLN